MRTQYQKQKMLLGLMSLKGIYLTRELAAHPPVLPQSWEGGHCWLAWFIQELNLAQNLENKYSVKCIGIYQAWADVPFVEDHEHHIPNVSAGTAQGLNYLCSCRELRSFSVLYCSINPLITLIYLCSFET